MINKVDIQNTLNLLDKQYNIYPKDLDMPILFSKLAVLEFCGWIEQSYDTILYDYLNTHITDAYNLSIIKGFIKKNHGFSFETNTYQIFTIVLGSNNWENILDCIPIQEKMNFKNILFEYAKKRNSAAHTNIEGVTNQYYTPSQVKSDFQKFLPAISKIENEIQKL